MFLVIGDINLDIIVNLRAKLNFDTDSQSEISFSGGGSAANFSYWLDYLGQKVRFIAKTGDDFIVNFLKEDFKETEIEFINLKSEKRNTGRIVILLSEDGARTMITDRGANVMMRPEDIKERYFDKVNHLHLGAYTFLGGKNMEESALNIIKKAKSKGITISFDPSSYSGLKKYGSNKILSQTKGIDFCFPNIDEAEELTQRTAPKKMVEKLLKNYKNVILKYGKRGCFIGDINGIEFIKQKEVIDKGDTTGAGDAFTAAFISNYYTNKNLKKAAVYANNVAAKCVKKTGGRPD